MAWLEDQRLGWGAGGAGLPRGAWILFFLLLPPRSHPTILDIPNQLYYDGELQACADVMDRERFCRWEGLPRQVRPNRGALLRKAPNPPFVCHWLEPLSP